METLFHYVAPPSQCGYLPEQEWQLEYEHFASLTAAEYMERMQRGWRRFGNVVFRPHCSSCSACQSLRVMVDHFEPDRSQRRARKTNDDLSLRIKHPSVTWTKLALYDRYHAHQADTKGWPSHPAKDPQEYANSFVENPFRTEEWCYFLGDRLLAVGYVDALPGGLSAIYFFYEPDERRRSLGTFNVLCLLEQAARRSLPYVYLGYYVAGCPSMTYKCRFKPNQLRGTDGKWRDFQT